MTNHHSDVALHMPHILYTKRYIPLITPTNRGDYGTQLPCSFREATPRFCLDELRNHVQ